MRVLVAVHGFPPLQNTGAERAAERIAVWLAQHGHHVEVFTIGHLNHPVPEVSTVEQDGFQVHRLSFDIYAGNEFTNLYDNPMIGQALKPVLERGKFDLIHLISGYLLGGQVIHTAHEMGIPVVLTLTEYFFMCPRLNLMHVDSSLCSGPDTDEKCGRCLLEGKRRFYYLKEASPVMADAFWTIAQYTSFAKRKSTEVSDRHEVMTNAFNQADLIIAPSQFILQKYAEYGYIHPNTVMIRHGVDRPSHIKPKHTSEQPLHIHFGYMGQMKSHKGVDMIVTAMMELINAGHACSLQIWGRSQDDPAYYRRMQKMTGGHYAVRFCGPFQGNRVFEVLENIDVLIVPSRWYENCPTVILEAFKMRIPVIATDLGGMAELVENEKSGLTFALNDVKDLARQMRRVMEDPGLFQRLESGIPYVKDASEEIAEIYAQYERLLGRSTQQPCEHGSSITPAI